jgi:hypothetical protein
MINVIVEEGMHEKYYCVMTPMGVLRLSSAVYRARMRELSTEDSLDIRIKEKFLCLFTGVFANEQ